MSVAKPLAICIMGPTAAGKTALAVELAQRLPFDIISVDSAMVYRGLDIGTAKPDAATLALAPHRLIDLLDPTEVYSAARFRADAMRELQASHARGRIPLLVGGTMFYFRALQYGLSNLPESDPALRARLDFDERLLGNSILHARLAQIDPLAAERIHPNDPQRTKRALEIFYLTGRPYTELCARNRAQALEFRLLKLVLAPAERSSLHQRIAERFSQMLEQGLPAEVERLRSRPELNLAKPALRAVGYRQVWEYLDGLSDYATMIQCAVSATRQFAKRQLTWLRAEADAHWLDSLDPKLFKRAHRLLRQNGFLR